MHTTWKIRVPSTVQKKIRNDAPLTVRTPPTLLLWTNWFQTRFCQYTIVLQHVRNCYRDDDDNNNNKQPQDQFKEAIKSAVASANDGLEKLHTKFEDIKRPITGTLQTFQDGSATAVDHVNHVYQRRHEYAPEIIGGTAVVTGGYFLLRRGRLAALMGGALGAGAAYAVVHDEFDFEKIPDVVFGKK